LRFLFRDVGKSFLSPVHVYGPLIAHTSGFPHRYGRIISVDIDVDGLANALAEIFFGLGVGAVVGAVAGVGLGVEFEADVVANAGLDAKVGDGVFVGVVSDVETRGCRTLVSFGR